MTKTILVAALAVVGMAFSSENVFAGRRNRCCRAEQPACGCQTACCANQCGASQCCQAAMSVTPATQPTGMSGPSASNGYQSYSYEPGVSANQMTVAPVVQTRRSTSFYDQFRGDRKARGIF